MQTADYIVLCVYFAAMAVIGIVCMFRVKGQEDFLMGGRTFGKLLQTFAAFGAGTGSNDPVNVGRNTWTSGLAGIWSVLMWLYVTPFYWIFGVWYRRMRHITIGDWYVERYQSPMLGAAYAVFGIYFYMYYLSSMFTAVVKVAVPLIGPDAIAAFGLEDPDQLKNYLIPAMGGLIVVYGILGGLKAAYWTDLIQGIGIIILSIILIPTGLQALVDKFGAEYAAAHEGVSAAALTWTDGFSIMHWRTPAEYFQIFGGPQSSDFPWHYIVSLTLLGLVGIVVQPHFIATGGGSAKTENAARIGLVAGNFLKRFCTIGWALTGLIVLTLMASSVEVATDPDKVWGVASREILSNLTINGVQLGLVGLMFACLLAAMMSSADCYMLMVSGLVTRNFYRPIRKNASEAEYLLVARLSGLVMIVGAAWISLLKQDVFQQFVSAVTLPIIFAATFWMGMWWRRANKWSAWLTILFITTVFYILPWGLPRVMPELRENQAFAVSNHLTTTTITRKATATDVAKRQAWEQARVKAEAIEDEGKRAEALKTIGKAPPEAEIGQQIRESFTSGGKSIFWASVEPVGDVTTEEVDRRTEGNREIVVEKKVGQFRGKGEFRTEMVLYHYAGVPLETVSGPMLTTMELPPKLVVPFLVMFLFSLVTPRTSKEVLDRYYVKMKVPVIQDAAADAEQLEEAYRHPEAFEGRKLFPGSSIEIQRPRWSDALGFVACFAICFGIVWFAVWVTNIGAT